MAIFPALVPSSRAFTPGEYPNTPYPALSRDETRVRHSNVMLDSTLRVSFAGLTEQDVVDILNHYQSQSGAWVPFDLPADLWSGVSDQANFELAGYFWRYSQPPEIEDQPCRPDGSMVYNVSVEFETVPPEGSITNGRNFRATITWSPGAAQGLAAGAGSSPGTTWLVVSEWAEQLPDAESPPALFDIEVSWVAGGASEATDFFNIVEWTGTALEQSVSGLGFEPGFVWTKSRSVSSVSNYIFDYARGATKTWATDGSSSEITDAQSLTSFDASGFTVGTSSRTNNSGTPFVGWCIAKGSAGVSNTDGSITTTAYLNSVAKLSIIAYTGSGAAATIGHGLGEEPALVIVKRLSGTSLAGRAGSPLLAADSHLLLTATAAQTSTASSFSGYSSTTISLTTDGSVNASGASYVAYAFASAAGGSQIGSYTGGGATETDISCGFPPQFVLIKSISATGNWMIFDSTRGVTQELRANSAGTEVAVDKITFNASGFTVKANQNANTSGVSYLYLAFR